MELIALVLSGATAALTLTWVVIGFVVVRKQTKARKMLVADFNTMESKVKAVKSELQSLAARVVKAEKKLFKLGELPTEIADLSEQIDYTTRELEVVTAAQAAAASVVPVKTPKPAKPKRVKVYKPVAEWDDEDDDMEEIEDEVPSRSSRNVRGPGRGRQYEAPYRDAGEARRGLSDRRDYVARRRI